jgi:hypothetical protein
VALLLHDGETQAWSQLAALTADAIPDPRG